MPNDRPNILVIMSDEHDRAVAGCYGDPLVQTPHLDRLAEEGILFRDAYTNSPLCVPARHSFTAGQYVSRLGCWTNSFGLKSNDVESLPRVLKRAGYDALLGGKMHFAADRRYGFTDLYNASSNGGRQVRRGTRIDPDSDEAMSGGLKRLEEFHPGEDSYILNHDREVTTQCSEFLRKRSAGDAPFFLLAGYLAPHFPLIVPEAYYERYRGKVAAADIPDGLIESLPTNYKTIRRMFGVPEFPEETVRQGRDLYWGLTNWLDDEIGKLLESLYGSEVAENTVVIYTSDHGENKGDHGMWWKNCMYEHSAGVPLIVRWPERWKGGQERKGACSLVDVVQTIVELAGGEAPGDWDGDSLLGWLDDESTDWKDVAISEYYGHNTCSGFTMYREGRWKYVYHSRINADHGPECELYDLEADPGEFTNLASRPDQADRLRAMHTRMVAEVGDPEESEARCRADFAETA